MMKKIFRNTGVVTGALLALVLGVAEPAAAQTRELGASGKLLDGIAAIVDDGVVLKSEVASAVAMQVAIRQQQQLPPVPLSALEERILEDLILAELLLQRGQRVGLQVSDQDLNQYLTAVAEENGLTLEQLPQALASQGIDYPTFREDRRKDVIRETLIRREVENRISISPRELSQCLVRLETAVANEVDYNVSHILVGISAAEGADAARERVEEVYRRLEQGEDFGQLAVAYSDAQTALEGGHLGWLRGSQLPTVFADTVIRMQAEEVSEPIQSGSGFHIVKLNEIRGADRVMQDQMRVRHVLLRPNELMDDDAVRQRLLQIREGILEGDEFGPIARAVSEDTPSAADGGEVGWVGPGDTVPEFEERIAQLDLDEISEPFQTRYGWHIVQVIDRRSHDLTDELKEQRCVQQIRATKAGEEQELWLRRLRDQAFVEILL